MIKFNELSETQEQLSLAGLAFLVVIVFVIGSCSVSSYNDKKTLDSKIQQRASVQFEEKTCSEGAEMPCHEWATVSSTPTYQGYRGSEFEITIWGGSNRTFTCTVQADGIVKKFDDVVVTISENGCRFERFVAF